MKLLNGVDNIPLELISAIENDEIVVFVGAGVSKPSPSNLPNFYELAKELGKENDKKVSKKEPIDRFLGDVADLNPEKPYLIHQKIIEKFSKVKTPNSLHENILKLFNNRIRIVTTNFDNLLSLKANQLGLEHKTYFAPALPYGDDFEGIVHLHGSIEDKPNNLIVTDKDFSNAYICRGWATTFLKELFSKYTVLFIGYSYNDTILNYLTRGIVSKKLFSIVENKDKDKWDRLGINSIGYVNADNSHSLLNELLIKIKEEILIDVITEKDKIKQLAKIPFAQLDDINKDYIKNRVLKKEWKLKQLLKNITDKNNWLKFFYENKNIDELFQRNNEISTLGLCFINWFIDSFMEETLFYQRQMWGQENGLIIEILKEKHNIISDKLYDRLLFYFAEKIENPKIYSFWLDIFMQEHNQKSQKSYYLTKHLDYCLKNNYITQAKILIKYLFKLKFNKNRREIESNFEECPFESIYAEKKHLLFFYYEELLNTISSEFEKIVIDISNTYDEDYVSYSTYSIRDFENLNIKENGRENSDIKIVTTILKEAYQQLFNKNKNLAKYYYYKFINSQTSLLKRFAIYCLYTYEILSPKKVLKFFIENKLLLEKRIFKHEVRHYFYIKYNQLNTEDKIIFFNYLFDYISDKNDDYETVYRFLRYIRKNNNCKLLEAKYNEIRKKLPDNIDEEQPCELDSYLTSSLGGGFVSYSSEYTSDKLISLDLEKEENIELLLKTEGDEIVNGKIFDHSRYGFVSEVENAVTESFEWGKKLYYKLLNKKYYDTDLFEYIFKGIIKINDKEKIHNEIFDIIVHFQTENKYFINNYEITSSYISLIKNTIKSFEIISDNRTKKIEIIKKILFDLWANVDDSSDKDILETNDSLNYAINTISGNIIDTLMSLLWNDYKDKNSDLSVFLNYKEFIEKEILLKETNKARIGLSIISSKMYYLFTFDSEWVTQNLIPLISDKNKYSIVWNSFSYSAPSFTKSFIIALHPHIKKLNENIVEYNRLINIERVYEFYILMYFTSLLFFKDIYRNFNIDKFINNIDEEKLGIFYNNLINKLDSEVIKKYSVKVEKWILSFWKKRLLYTSSSKEKTELLYLLFKVRVERIDECIEIIKLTEYEQLDDHFIYKIQNKEYDKLYPQKTIFIFNAIITERTIENENFAFHYLKEIITGLVENNKTNNDLRELLTKLITLNCDWANDLLEKMDIK